MFLSIIIPTFNSAKYIQKCLDSIVSQDFEGIEIIVIDNGSNDFTSDLIEINYPQVVLIKNEKNTGSSFARNQGIKYSSGDYLVFLDSDTYLEKGFLTKLSQVLENIFKNVAGISSKILNHNLNTIFSCGLRISTLYRIYDVGQGSKKDNFSECMSIDGLNSCCAIIRRTAIEEIKTNGQYFDEDFFFLFEDVDLSLRLSKKGNKFLFIPDLICYHLGGGSKYTKDFRRYLCFRNRWYIILKNNRGRKLGLFFLRSFFYDLVRTLHFSISNKYFLKAVQDIYNYCKVKREKTINI